MTGPVIETQTPAPDAPDAGGGAGAQPAAPGPAGQGAPVHTRKPADTKAGEAVQAGEAVKTTPAKSGRRGGVSLAALRARLTAPVLDIIEAVSERAAVSSARDFALQSQRTVHVLAAFSGGRDSAALLDVLSHLKHNTHATRLASVTAVHIHHGLSKNADAWVGHCRAFCEKRGIELIVEKVYVAPHSALGVEAAARRARYRALARIAAGRHADVVMTAHHLDDRIETFLIQWMRGAGPEGLSAMTELRSMEGLQAELGAGSPAHSESVLARPWLAIDTAAILAYAKRARLEWVEDDSNGDVRYLRNLIRRDLLPVLDKARPGWRTAAARSIELVGDSARLVRDLARDDLARIADDEGNLKIAGLLALSAERQALALRAWLAQNSLRSPSRVKTLEILRQLRESQNDTRLVFRIENKELRRWAGRLVLREAVVRPKTDPAQMRQLDWQGQDEIGLGVWGGVLRFVRCAPGEDGIDARLLRTGKLEVRPRKGGEKIKLHRLRPSRHLKHLYQAAGVAAFDRSALPLVWLDGRLIFCAGLGMDVREFADRGLVAERIRFEWVPDRTLLAAR